MGQKSTKNKKDLLHLTEEDIDRLTKNTTYSKQQIQDWHQGFLRYDIKQTVIENQRVVSLCIRLVTVQMEHLIKRNF